MSYFFVFNIQKKSKSFKPVPVPIWSFRWYEWSPNSEILELGTEGQWGDGNGDFLEEVDTEDDSEDLYSNLNTRG